MKKITYISGLMASIFYIFSVIVGGMLWPGYSHVRQPISELTMASAPNLILMSTLFAIYGFLLLTFGIGMFVRWRKSNKLLAISGVLLILCSLSGLLMNFAPQDPIGTPLTTKGLMHLILAGIASITTLFTMFFAAFGFGKEKNKKLKSISLLFGIFVLISGPITAMAPTKLPDYFGVMERFTIGSFIIWLLIVSSSLLGQEKQPKN